MGWWAELRVKEKRAEGDPMGSVPGVDTLEAAVVIPGIETSFRLTHFFTTADDAPRAAVALTWGRHGVFTVVAARLAGQEAFAVAEHRAVLGVAKGAASQDALVYSLRLHRQGRQGHHRFDGSRVCWGGASRLGLQRHPLGGDTQHQSSQESRRPRCHPGGA